MIRSGDPQRGRSAYQLADVFCRQSRQRVDALFRELWDNTDDVDRKLTARVMDGDMTWLEEGVIDASEGTGPWIADTSFDGAEPSGSAKESVHRSYR
ncbi:MAG: acyl-CoA dehydrogenase family protein, partial [Humibacter sp.]